MFGKLGLNNGGRLAAGENRKVFRKAFHPVPRPAIWLKILVQVEAKVAPAVRQAHEKSSEKTSSVREWPVCFKLRIHPFAGLCHNTAWALDPSARCEPRASRPSRFACAFLGVFRGVLVQLRFNDIRCFGGFGPAESAARTLGLKFSRHE